MHMQHVHTMNARHARSHSACVWGLWCGNAQCVHADAHDTKQQMQQ